MIQLIKNSFYTALPPLLRVASGFWITALVINSLGNETFAVWKVATSFFAMSWILQLGMNSYINRVIPYNIEQGNIDVIERTVTTIAVFYKILAMLIFILGAFYIVSRGFEDGFNNLQVQAIGAGLVGYTIFTPLSFYRSILTAHQNYKLITKIDMLSNVFYIACILIVVYTRLDVFYYFLFASLPIFMPSILCALYCNKKKYKYISKGKGSVEEFKKGLPYSTHSMVFSICMVLSNNFVILLVSNYYGTDWVAKYSLSYQLMSFIPSIMIMMLAVIKPEVARLDGVDKKEDIFKVYSFYTKLCLYSVLVVVFSIALSYDYLITLWLGSKLNSVGMSILMVVGLGQVSWVVLQVNYFTLNGIGKHAIISKSLLFLQIGSYLLFFLFIEKQDEITYFLMLVFSSVFIAGFFVSPFYIKKELSVSSWKDIFKVYFYPVISFSLVAILLIFLMRILDTPLGIFYFLEFIVINAVLYLLFLYFLLRKDFFSFKRTSRF